MDLRSALARRRAAEATVEPLIDVIGDFGSTVADSVGKGYNLANPRVETFLRDYMSKRVDMINQTTRDALRKAADADDPAAAVRKVFKDARERRAKIIAESEIVRSSNFAALDAGKWVAQLDFKVWASQKDGSVRHEHQEPLDGQIRAWNEDFVSLHGYRGKAPGLMTGGPDMNVNCFPGDVPVSFSGLRKVYRRWYEGDLVVLTLNDGRQLPVTPKHPLLTMDGWRPASSLEQGDHLISEESVNRLSQMGAQPDRHHGPVMLTQVYGAGIEVAPACRTLGVATDFHGDGRNGDVDVVFIDRQLMMGLEASGYQHIQQFLLAYAYRARAALSALNQFSMRTLNASYGVMRSFRETATLLGIGLRHAHVHASAAVPRFYPSLQQASPDRVSINANNLRHLLFGMRCVEFNDPSCADRTVSTSRPVYSEGLETSVKSGLPDAEALEDLLRRDAFGSQLQDHRVDVVGKSVVRWAGHVYNLETGCGHYSAMRVLVHNCRCAALPARSPQRRELGRYGDPVELYDTIRAPHVAALERAWRRVFREQEAAVLAELDDA